MSANLQTLCDAVDGGALMRHVGVFAQWEKLSGSAGEADSLRYIQAQLDALGFRTRLLSHDAYISLPGRSLVQVDNTALRSITHSFSRASADGVRGELVHVGAGGDADFAGRDLRGCIVLVDGIATPPVSRRASLAGADRAVAHQSARASARDVHLAGVGQSVRRHARRTADDRRLQRAAVGWRGVARTPGAWRATVA